MDNNCYSSTKKVLLLGISYPDVEGHMKAHNYDMEILQHQDGSVDQAVECVRRKILTEMDGRDLARVVATENVGDGYEAYTVSKEMGGIYKENRHVYASFNNSRSMRKAMAKAFGTVQFQQVILDYYWMPTVSLFVSYWYILFWLKKMTTIVNSPFRDSLFLIKFFCYAVRIRFFLNKSQLPGMAGHEMGENALSGNPSRSGQIQSIGVSF